MPVFLTFVLLAAQLGAPFIDATATGTRSGDSEIQVDLEVQIDALNVSTVFAHLSDPGGGQFTTPLNDRGDGRYGAIVTLSAADAVVVFEALAPGDSVLSQPTTLGALGLDLALLGPDRPFATVEPEADDSLVVTPSARRWGWAAVGLLATSLALLAVWAAGPRRRQDDRSDAEGSASVAADSPPDR